MSDCRRITDPAPTRRTCIEMLAEGYHHANDMCPHCTRALMTALDGIAGKPLAWHPNFLARAEQ